MTLNNNRQKINDCLGNPVEIGIAVTWKVVDTAKAAFNVDNYKEYLLGRDLLVAPIRKQGRTDRHVILPDDTWIELNSGREYEGGTVFVEAPMGTIPVFCRKNHTQISEETLQEVIKEMKS